MREVIEIKRLGLGSDAIGYLSNGKTVFVPFAVPGDSVIVELVSDGEKFARGKIAEIAAPSEHRMEAPCPYFTICGGCDLQHVSYELELKSKSQNVFESLKRIGKLEDTRGIFDEILSTKHEYGYRNKVEFAVRNIDRKLELGFHKRGSDEIVNVDSCLLMPKKFAKAPKAIRGSLSYLKGGIDQEIERVALRMATFTNDAELAVYNAPGKFPRAMMAKALKDAVPGLTSIARVLLKDSAESRRVSGVEVLAGKGFVAEKMNKFDYAISAPSFWQVNTRAAQLLVDRALEYLEPDGSDAVLDLFSGVGTFTLPLAERAGEVIAVESYGPAVSDLRRNMEHNEMSFDIVGGDASTETASLKYVNKVLVDPPRSGLTAKLVKAISEQNRIKDLVYVSCNPSTLARDIERLKSGGFELKKVTPVDLFPQTSHVETVTLLKR